MSGVVMGAKLRDAGLRRIMLIDKAGGIGGTWYWNRYPGVMCDVESYIYMPMLEEMNYVPTTRYAFGDEIRRHLDAIATKYGLVDDALFHTGVETSEWDESASRWVIRTDRGDEVRARYLIMARRHPQPHEAAGDPRHGGVRGQGVPHRALGLRVHRRLAGRPAPHQAGRQGGRRRRRAARARSRPSPPLAESAKHVYVFQRTPSAIGERGNRPDRRGLRRAAPPRLAAGADGELQRGHDRARRSSTTSSTTGGRITWRKVTNPAIEPGMAPEDIARRVEEFDYAVMEEHRDADRRDRRRSRGRGDA